MEKLNLTYKRAQAWSIDLIIASIIFTVSIIAFYVYTMNSTSETKEEMENMFYDGKLIGDALLSEGYPQNWTSDNVITIGITSEEKVDEAKLENFYALSVSDYNKTKSIFNTKYNYYFVLNGSISVNGGSVDGIGEAPLDPANLIKITRLTVYKDKPTTAYLYIWE